MSDTPHHSTPIGERLCPLHIDSWTGPFAEDQRAKAVDALEHGKVLVLPHLAVSVPRR